MERLTEYFELGAYTDRRNNIIDVSDKLPLFENGVIMGKAVDKLAEFEDFMEEVEAESLDELESCIVDLKQETQALKDRWQKLKEFVYQYTSLAKECRSGSQASRMVQANKIYAKMEQMEEEE